MLGIYGGSGSGKSALAKIFVEHFLIQGIPSIILSAKNDFLQLLKLNENTKLLEYKEVLESKSEVIPISFTSNTGIHVKFPIFDLPRKKDRKLSEMEVESRIDNSVNLLTEYGFSTKSQNYRMKLRLFLNELIKDAYEHDFDFYSIAALRKLITINSEKLKINKLKGDEIDLGLRALTTGIKKQLFETGVPFDLDFFLSSNGEHSKSNIFMLQELNMEDQEWLVSKICDMLYDWGASKGETDEIRAVLVIDEAAMYCPSGNRKSLSKESINRLVRLARHYGVFVLLATQLPKDLSTAVRGNLGITIFGKSTSENIDVIYDNVKDNRLVSSIGITKNQMMELKEREFCIVGENQVNFFNSRNAIIDLTYVPSKDELEIYSTTIQLPKMQEIEHVNPFAIPEEQKETSTGLPKDENDEIRFLSIKDNLKDYDILLNEAIQKGVTYYQLITDTIIYVPYNLISANVRINSITPIKIGNEIIELIPDRMYTHTVLLPNNTSIEIDSVKYSINELVQLDHYSTDDRDELLFELDPHVMDPVLSSEFTGKISTENAVLIIKKSISDRVEKNFAQLKYDENEIKELIAIENEKIKEIIVKKSPLEDMLGKLDTEIKRLNKLKIEAADKAENSLKQYKRRAKKEYQDNAKKYLQAGKQFNEKKKANEERISQTINLIAGFDNQIKEIKDNIEREKSLANERNRVFQLESKNLSSWQFKPKDTINKIKVDYLYIPFKILEFSIINPAQEKRNIICIQESHKGSKLYILCDRFMEGNTGSDFHKNLHYCSTCFKLICNTHSQISAYTGNRNCHEHLSTCYTCGVTEIEFLLPCEGCAREFCYNHLTEVEIGTFRKKKEIYCNKCLKELNED